MASPQYTVESINRALDIHKDAGRIASWIHWPADGKSRDKWTVTGNGGTHPNYIDCDKRTIRALVFGLASAGYAKQEGEPERAPEAPDMHAHRLANEVISRIATENISTYNAVREVLINEFSKTSS